MSRTNLSLTDQNVTILMGVRNGEAHLPAQLNSIAAQTHRNWSLVCSDDGSTDATRDIIRDFAKDHPDQVTLRDGPQRGFSANFMKMIADLPSDVGAVAFADQDDIWESDKLARGLKYRRNTDAIPTLYSSRCWYWYPDTDQRVLSRNATRPATFRNALIENIATGNTILLNPPAAQLARTAAQRTDRVFVHDWWLYLLISGAGGQIDFDGGAPTLLYRQHAENAIGGGQSASEQVQRKIKVLQGAFSNRIASNLRALNLVRDLLTPDHLALLDSFSTARQAGLLGRLNGLRKVGPYRQTFMGNLGFWGAASLGRI